MDTKTSSGLWWMKSSTQDPEGNLVVPKLDLRSPSSIVDLLEKDGNSNKDDNVDVGSIIEEINRVAAQSPLGPYEKNSGERSIEDLMKEAERIYMESSKSFEQLSQRSKTSQNISDLLSSLSKDSTPTPKSISPLPMDPEPQHSSNDSESYTEDFSEESKIESNPSPTDNKMMFRNKGEGSGSSDCHINSLKENVKTRDPSLSISKSKSVSSIKEFTNVHNDMRRRSENISILSLKQQIINEGIIPTSNPGVSEQSTPEDVQTVRDDCVKQNEVIEIKDKLIKTLEEDNRSLKLDIQEVKLELQKTVGLLEQTKARLSAKQASITSPEINLELEKALEDLKDSKEANTALQLQLDTINKTHQLLKGSYDELLNSNKHLERKVVELDATLDKYKSELLNLQQAKDKLQQNEVNLTKLLEIEKLQGKSLKLQNEKDSRCIQDLNRQIKEMERIIARKHPDSVSALIVAAKESTADSSSTARRVLEERIKSLEKEQMDRESQNAKVFLEIQEKFNQIKSKYEHHIEDLELHVSDLKTQLKSQCDTYDVYTQTAEDEKIPQKETFTVSTQTTTGGEQTHVMTAEHRKGLQRNKEDAHLLATIRGLQTDLANKEKVIIRLQKEVDDLKKTNRRLQKEREGSLRNLSDRSNGRDFRSYPEKLALQARSNSLSSEKDIRDTEELLQQIRNERDKLRQQLKRIEEDYQKLKEKRIQDLTALQEAHEQETANYLASVTPLREQLEIQQVSISTLQQQLSSAREELAVVKAERDHLNERLIASARSPTAFKDGDLEVDALLKKIQYLEKRYEEREYRLRAIVHSLAQKSVTSDRSCEQCAERQSQLIAYKVELDQLLATVRALH